MGIRGVDININVGVSYEENDEDEFIEHLDNHTEVSGQPTMEIPEKRCMHEPVSELFTEIGLAKDTSSNSLRPARRGQLWDPEIDEPIVGPVFKDKKALENAIKKYVTVPSNLIMVACDFDMCFTFVSTR